MRVVRLIFTYDLTGVQLADYVVVEDLQRRPPAADRSGVYVELRDATNRTITRVPVRGAFAPREVFPERPDTKIQRVAATRTGAFLVTVPVASSVVSLALVQRGVELASFPWVLR